MPYIPKADRERFYDDCARINTPGELNYKFTDLINWYRSTNQDSYRTFNDILGALEGAKLEFYRRIVAPYEDKKTLENGDVY